MKKLLKPLALAILSLAMLAPAQAGDNSCSGTISTDKNWVYIVDHPTHGNVPECRAKLDSNAGRRILAICQEGSSCTVHLPLEGSARDKALDRNGNRLPIVTIDIVTNDEAYSAAVDIVAHQKCGKKFDEVRLQQIAAVDKKYSTQVAAEVKRETKFANSDPGYCTLFGRR
jgi:hypothetical protein